MTIGTIAGVGKNAFLVASLRSTVISSRQVAESVWRAASPRFQLASSLKAVTMSRTYTDIPGTVVSLVRPSVEALAARLFVLTSGRKGSQKYKPTVCDFYETGIVTVLYEHLLMSPLLQHMDIRHEMPYHGGGRGSPQRVDLWLRPFNGGYPHLIEAGDFAKGKVHDDLAKIKRIAPKGLHWFLAFFRKANASRPWKTIQNSLARLNGLDPSKVVARQELAGHFDVYRPDGNHDHFGYAC